MAYRGPHMPTLPRSGPALSIANFEASLSSQRLSCDLRQLRFIDAYGLVGTACAMRAAGEVELLVPTAANACSHLSAMGFRDFLSSTRGRLELPVVSTADAPDVVVPLRSTSDSGGAQALSNLLWEQLRDHVAPQVLQAMTEGVWEMVANALEHSGTDALIMGQAYRAPRGTAPDHDNRVQLVIGDTGRGIRESFLTTSVHTPTTDREAVSLALEYLVSSVADDPGRGQGLTTTMEQVVETQGRMVVRSGTARVSISGEGRVEELVAFLPGVIVALSLPLYPG
ncbi:MAG: hypothetical protein QOD83_1099 [Solirubrobacteraceae bacterium]|nr:hypothetical protein [Solirubrobacteraceae bacterium]